MCRCELQYADNMHWGGNKDIYSSLFILGAALGWMFIMELLVFTEAGVCCSQTGTHLMLEPEQSINRCIH